MSISLRSVGEWQASTGSSQEVSLPEHQVGDMILVRVGMKPYNTVPTCATSGWAQVAAAYVNGNDAPVADWGSVKVITFWKIATTTGETNPVISFGTANSNPSGAVAIVYQKGAGETWATPLGAGGGDVSSGTDYSATITSHIPVHAGDVVDFFTTLMGDQAITSMSVTQAGVTFDTVSMQPATDGTTSSGDDGQYTGGYRVATAGSSTAAAVVAGTITASRGSSWTTRLRTAKAVVTQAAVEVVITPTTANARTTNVTRLTAIEPSARNARTTQVTRLAAVEPSAPNARTTQLSRLAAIRQAWATYSTFATGTGADPATISLPPFNTGDLLIVHVYIAGIAESIGNWTYGGSTTAFTQLWSVGSTGGKSVGRYRVMQAGDSGTVSVDLSSASPIAYEVIRVPAGDFDASTAPEAATTGESFTGTPNPPSITPSWGSDFTLFLVTSFSKNNVTLSSYPAGYLAHGYVTSTAAVASAYLAKTASSEDPGAFTWSADQYAGAQTIAIRRYVPRLTGSLAATGGGILTWSAEADTGEAETHSGSFAATGGGVAAVGGAKGGISSIGDLPSSPEFVQEIVASVTDENSTTHVLSPSSKTVTAGNTIVVGVGAYQSNVYITGITDNLGNEYVYANKVSSPASMQVAEMWYSHVENGGSITTITITYQTNHTYKYAVVAEFSGLADLPATGDQAKGSGTPATWASDETIPAYGAIVGLTTLQSNTTGAAGSASGSPSTSISQVADALSSGWMDGYISAAIAGSSEVTGFTGTTTFTDDGGDAWGGVSAIFDPAGAGLVALTATGGGVLTWDAEAGVASENHNGSFTSTGGGTATVVATTARKIGDASTASGAAAFSSTSGRLGAFAATGSGVITWVSDGTFVEEHSGSITATGGGAATIEASSSRSSGITGTGSGTIVQGTTTNRSTGVTAAGGGAFAQGATTGRAEGVAATGGGASSLSTASARQLAAAMSGGGVLTWGAVAAFPEYHDGSFVATGGGTATILAATARSTGTSASGSGVFSTDASTGRGVTATASGGGSLVEGVTTARLGWAAPTGGGGLSDGFTSARWGTIGTVTGSGQMTLLAVALAAGRARASISREAHATATLSSTKAVAGLVRRSKPTGGVERD